MEWMLQVADELDDAVGALRHLVFAWRVEIASWLPLHNARYASSAAK
jgi:hypothetical protein